MSMESLVPTLSLIISVNIVVNSENKEKFDLIKNSPTLDELT